jgi:hypothetical protein
MFSILKSCGPHATRAVDPRGRRPRGSEPARGAGQTGIRGGWSGGDPLNPAGNASLPSGTTETRVPTSAPATVNIGCEYFIMQVASRHFWQSNGDDAFFGQHGISPAISTDSVSATAWTCAAIDIDENGIANGERITPTAIKNASNRRMINRRFIDGRFS